MRVLHRLGVGNIVENGLKVLSERHVQKYGSRNQRNVRSRKNSFSLGSLGQLGRRPRRDGRWRRRVYQLERSRRIKKSRSPAKEDHKVKLLLFYFI